MAIEMRFLQNTHHPYGKTNMTIRLGVKWSLKLDNVDEFLALGVHDKSRIQMKVKNVRVMRLRDLAEMPELLQMSHLTAPPNWSDKQELDFNTLAIGIFDIYGHGKMSIYDIVTVIEYEVKK